MGSTQIEHIVIAGGHVAGWTVAAAFVKSLDGMHTRITLIDLPATESTAQSVSTFPQTPTFHDHLDIDEADLLREACGTFKLGTRYRRWRSSAPDFFNACGAHGKTLGIVPFHQFALKLRQLGDTTDFNDYSVAAVAARLGRFPAPGDDAGSQFGNLTYGIQLDSDLYALYMRDYAVQKGVSVVQGSIHSVSIRGGNGFIETVVLDNGERLQADFFVDCSGVEARLAGSARDIEFDDWGQWLPCDRVMSVATARQRNPDPFTTCDALDSGWLQRIPLQHVTVNEYAWCSRYEADQDARTQLDSELDGHAMSRFQTRRVRSGLRRKPWDRNCVAFGGAAGGFEPLENIGLQLLQGGILRFLGMFPDKSCNPPLSDEFNRITRREYENVRDFLLLRYRVSDRGNSAFWRHANAVEPPDSLRHRIELFVSRGRLAYDEYDTFSRDNWISTMLANGLVPEGYDPLVDAVDANRIEEELRRIRRETRQAAEAMPAHRPGV